MTDMKLRLLQNARRDAVGTEGQESDGVGRCRLLACVADMGQVGMAWGVGLGGGLDTIVRHGPWVVKRLAYSLHIDPHRTPML